MKKLSLDLDALTVQSFATDTDQPGTEGTVLAFAKAPPSPTGYNDPYCSHIDNCPSALGCTRFNCETADPDFCFTLKCDTLDIGC